MGNASIAELAAYARENADKFMRESVAQDRKARAAAAEREREQQVKKHAPSWARDRAQRELSAIVNEVVAGGAVTDEHKAAYAKLDHALGGGQA